VVFIFDGKILLTGIFGIFRYFLFDFIIIQVVIIN